jgi:hypothetical protein
MSPDTFAAYVEVEQRLDDAFQHNRPLASIAAAPGVAGFDVHWLTCPRCAVPVLANVREQRAWCPAHAETGPWLLPAPNRRRRTPCAPQTETLFDLPSVTR